MSWAGRNNGKIVNQFYGGGNKKAGIASSVGLNQFAFVAAKGKQGRAANTIPPLASYVVSIANQVGGIGRNTGVFMNTSGIGAPNQQIIALGAARLRAGRQFWV